MTIPCQSCRFEAADGSRFCGRCGGALAWRCDGCGHDNALDLRFCAGCGRSPAPATPAIERRPVTGLFVDVVDSTMMALSLDDEEFHSLLLSVTSAVSGTVRAAGGYVSEILGDGVVAFFGIPDAHEDDAVRAVRAGLAAVEVGRSGTSSAGGVVVRLRAGIHSGTTVVGAKDGAGGDLTVIALGVIPTMAARLQSAAAPGEVLCSEATWQLVEGYIDGEPVGPFELKGFPTAVTAWRANGLTLAVDRVDARLGRTAFVGRADELVLLSSQADRARAGKSQVVVVTGEAGIGKSRLVRAFIDGPAGQAFSRTVVRGQPDQLNTPLAPVIENLELARRGSDGQPVESIGELLASSDVDREAARLIGALLDAPGGGAVDDVAPEVRWARTIDALCRLVRGRAGEQPHLLQVEDAQWLDPSMLTLLAQLVEQPEPVPLLIIVTARPEFVPTWARRDHVRTIPMQRLSTAESAQLVAGQLGGEVLAPDVIAAITARSEGVPLYLEELAWLARKVPQAPLAGHVPDTLQNILRARLDRLGRERSLAAVAAALGRDVDPSVLAEVESVSESAVTQRLATLVQRDVLRPRPSPDGITYEFRHALLRDAAYGSLVRSDRREVHHRVATVLAERFPDRAARHPEELAHHYARAEMPALALRAWRSAARLAGARHALTEAAGAYENALEMLRALPVEGRDRRELGVLLELAAVLHSTAGAGDARFRTVADRAIDLARVVDDQQSLFAALTIAAAHHSSLPDRARAEPLLREQVALVDTWGEQRLDAMSALGTNAVLWGERAEGLRLLEACRAIHHPGDAPNHYDAGLAALLYRSIVLRELGRVGEAREARLEVEELAARAQPFNRCLTAVQLATMASLRADGSAAAEHLAIAGRDADQHGFLTLGVRIAILRAAADAQASGGSPDGADESLELCRRQGTMASTSPYRLLVAEAWAAAGMPDRALQAADDALAFVAATGEAEYAAELHRVRGQQLAALGDPAGAAAALRTGVDVASRDGAALFAARAAAAWQAVDRDAAEPALRSALAGVVLDVDEPDVNALRAIASTVSPVARP